MTVLTDPSAGLPRRLTVAFRAILFVVAGAVILATIAPLVRNLLSPWRELATGSLAAMATWILTWLFVKWDRIPLSRVGADLSRGSIARFAIGFAIGAGLIAVWAVLSMYGRHVRWSLAPGGVSIERGVMVLVYLTLATREELAFRGYPFRGLNDRFGAVAAQAIIAVLFILEHRLGGMSWSDAVIGSGTGSILFGAATLASGGLAVPIGVHSAWNIGQWALGMKNGDGIWTAVLPAGDAAVQYRGAILLHAFVMISGAFLFGLWLRRRRS